jgi:SAM-dependent MidA family methyltransferase
MGIRQRIEMLLNNAEADTAKSLIDSYEWLTSPDKMGKKFKFLSLTNSTEHIPTPF